MSVKSSVRYENKKQENFRIAVAHKQATLNAVPIDTIINHVNCFLSSLKMPLVKNPTFTDYNLDDDMMVTKDFYDKIQREYKLNKYDDIVWMKFSDEGIAKCGYLCTVATGADINFRIPSDESDYCAKCERDYRSKTSYLHLRSDDYEYNSCGVIMHKLQKSYDTKFVLVFPLNNIPDQLKRGDIEAGIGNYLIAQGVPILDYYSHKF